MPGMITRRQIGELKQRLKSEELSKESRILEELREFFKIKERLFEFSPNVGGCCSVFSLSGELLRRYYSQPYLISIHDIGCSFSKK